MGYPNPNPKDLIKNIFLFIIIIEKYSPIEKAVEICQLDKHRILIAHAPNLIFALYIYVSIHLEFCK